MTECYKVSYSAEALNDLKRIYAYIAYDLLVPEVAVDQIGRIRKENDKKRYYQ